MLNLMWLLGRAGRVFENRLAVPTGNPLSLRQLPFAKGEPLGVQLDTITGTPPLVKGGAQSAGDFNSFG